jgi:predicted metal-dependent hydrolase
VKAAFKQEIGIVEIGNQTVSFSIFRSRRRKRTIAFKVERDASLHVLAPTSASVRAVTKVLQKRAAWIAKELEDRKQVNEQEDYIDGAFFTYLGHVYKLKVTQGENKKRACYITPHVLHVHVPYEGLSGKDVREEVKLEILLWIKKRAKVKLKKRLDLWAERLDVTYKKMIVTDPSQRWGSCSVDNIIRLNWRLMLAPLPLLDYVVAHELSHVRHKNHSVRFWNFLAKGMPDYQERRQNLRRIERGLML